METIYWICFLFGAAFTAVSFLLGHADIGHFGHHHGNGHGHSGHGHDDRSPLAFLNLPALLAFLTWFGAAGVLLSRGGLSAGLTVPPAVVAGLVAGWLIMKLFAKLRAGEQELDPADFRLPGTIGQLTVGIPSGGVGEIVFTKGGRRRSEAARSTGGQPIEHGAEVVITSYEHGIATVQRWDEFVGQSSSEQGERSGDH